MSDDVLAEFRKQPLASAPVPTIASTAPPRLAAAREPYLAYRAKDRVARLKVRRRKDPSRAPGYAYLYDVMSNEVYGDSIVLSYSWMMVMIAGRNLQEIAKAIEMGNCEFVQEFDPERWIEPKPNVPFIQRIDVVCQGGDMPESPGIKTAQIARQQILGNDVMP